MSGEAKEHAVADLENGGGGTFAGRFRSLVT